MLKKHSLTTAQIAVLLLVLSVVTKILGFVREMVLANYFGAGSVTDAFVMGQSIPNTLVAFVITAVSTAFMPIFSRKYEQESEKSANLFASRLINLQLVFVAVITLLGIIFAEPLVKLFAPGYSAETTTITVYYMRIAFFVLFFTACINILSAILEYKGTFVAQSAISMVQNICVIAFIVIAAYTSYKVIIYGLIAGNALRLIGEYFVAKSKGFKYTPSFAISNSIKEATVLALPILVSGSFSDINRFIDRMLGSTLAEGSVSALNYGSLVVTTLVSLTAGIASTLVYPKLNKAYASGDNAKVSELTETGINLVALICIPLTLGAMVYSNQIIQIIYERGAFTEAATAATAEAFFFYVISLVFTGVTTIITRVFFTLHNTVTPAVCGIAAVIINIGLNFALVKPMGLGGLALATAISGIVGTFTQAIVFRKKYREITLIKNVKKIIYIILFSVCAVGLSYLLFIGLRNVNMPLIIRLGLSIITAVAVYLLLMYICKFKELSIIKQLVGKDEKSEN